MGRRGSVRSALKKSALKHRKGEGNGEIPGSTQKIWHSKCRGSREDASCTKKVALKIQQGRKRRRETGVADEERCGEFALIFFRTKRLEEFTILVERGWNAGTVLFCSIRWVEQKGITQAPLAPAPGVPRAAGIRYVDRNRIIRVAGSAREQ